jgi:cytochrome c-type biogenesis protein CcmH/NrfG
MRKQAWLFLIIGFAVGFGVLYIWTKQRAPEIVRAMPLPVGTGGQQASGFPAEPPPPPVDLARVRQLEEEIKANPGNYDALVELGNTRFDQKNFSGAIDLYAKALAVRPDDVNLRTDLGTALFYANRFDDAIAEFKRALEIRPNHTQAMFNIGVALVHGKNDLTGALQYWEKLVAVSPNDPQINMVKEQIRLLKEQLSRQ